MGAIKQNPNSTLNVDKYGTKRYYLPDGKTLHREDGPALEYSDGYKVWYINGKVHRLDGPAKEYGENKEWWIDEKKYSFKEWDRLRKMLWMM